MKKYFTINIKNNLGFQHLTKLKVNKKGILSIKIIFQIYYTVNESNI